MFDKQNAFGLFNATRFYLHAIRRWSPEIGHVYIKSTVASLFRASPFGSSSPLWGSFLLYSFFCDSQEWNGLPLLFPLTYYPLVSSRWSFSVEVSIVFWCRCSEGLCRVNALWWWKGELVRLFFFYHLFLFAKSCVLLNIWNLCLLDKKI